MMDSIYLTYQFQPVGKTKNEQSHAGRTPFCDVIVVLKMPSPCQILAYSGFLEAFFMFFFCNIKCDIKWQEKESIICVRIG